MVLAITFWFTDDHCLHEEFGDTKGISKSVNRRRTDNTKAKRKRAINDLQNNTQKTKDRGTPTPLETE